MNRNFYLIGLSLLCMFMLNACGGGGSSSAGSADKIVTQCIDASRESIQIGQLTSQARYTNTCDFTVSLAFRTITVAGPITLSANASHTSLFGRTGAGDFIACRPPSQATNKGDAINIELDCS